MKPHDVRLSDVGLDNDWYSFDRRPDSCNRETSQKIRNIPTSRDDKQLLGELVT